MAETLPDNHPAPFDGVEALRAQVERRSRAVPPPRKPRPAAGASVPPDELGKGRPLQADALPVQDSPAPTAEPRLLAKKNTAGGASDDDGRPHTSPNEPVANLAIRVRRSLDDRLGDLIHALRQDGVRTSKVELLELLLWELPPAPTPELRARLGAFRQRAPREIPL